MKTFSMLINGKKVNSSKTFDVINPADKSVVGQCPEATSEHLDQAVAAAQQAFKTWSATPAAERKQKIHAIADAIEANAGELAELLTLEQGKPLNGFADLGANFEIGGAIAWTRATAELE